MRTSILKAGLLGALTLTAVAPAFAEEGDWGPVTAGVALTSDYRFRGQSQSARDGALQGWIQYDHNSGLFLNVWGSTIDFNDEATYDSSVEIDLTAGYTHAFSEETKAGIRAVYYWYADADTPAGMNDYDYFELIASASHDFGKAAISGELAWSPDYFLESSDAITIKGGVSVPLMDQVLFMGALSASGNIGYQWIDDNATFGTPDYLYYDLGLSAEWEIFVIDARWVGTDLSKAQCFTGTDLCEDGFVLTITANLPG